MGVVKISMSTQTETDRPDNGNKIMYTEKRGNGKKQTNTRQ